ncbi:hypothetical protein [Chromobacterium amazonense]|uniref:hypothetical protein n=1 Tax=Chromobacterium amazonense TaxID=1382803 RepID=UPI003F797B74
MSSPLPSYTYFAPYGIPGLRLALLNGHANTVKTITEIVLESSLSEKSKVSILEAKQEVNGTHGLQLAFQNNHSEAIRSFICPVLNSNLSEENKVALLKVAAETNDDNDIALALQNGNTETVMKVFTDAVSCSNLSLPSKNQLLAGR